MTVKQMVELVTQSFPAFGRTQILFELNIAQREFCFATDVLMSVASLNRTDDAVSITAESVETWQLPIDTYRVIQIDELYTEQYEIQDDKLLFVSIDKWITSLLVRYTRIPQVMANDADSPSIPEEFHEAILCKVMAKYYRKSGDFNNSMAETQRMKELERAAKRYVNSARYRNVGAFVGGTMAEKVAFGRQSLVEGLNTISMGKSFTSVNSYVIMLNGNGITVQEYDPNDNNDQRTVSTFVVVSAEENPNFEYFATGT